VILLGRRAAAAVYMLAALAVPVSNAVAVWLGRLPATALVALAPSLLLVGPFAWALRRPSESVPVPALGLNVVWILSTNLLLAAGIALAR
jgi:1,4-dihydroxy-2-naphthoate octaprenyltransferase